VNERSDQAPRTQRANRRAEFGGIGFWLGNLRKLVFLDAIFDLTVFSMLDDVCDDPRVFAG
jgi:hypothetical protein